MARKTAAERRAEAEQARKESEAATWAEFVKSYPARFANAMYDFLTNSPALAVKRLDENSFEFYRNDQAYYDPRTLPAVLPETYSWELIYALESVENQVEELRAERDAEWRRMQTRAAALAKLTPEEREALDL